MQVVSENKTHLFECLKLYTLIISRTHKIIPPQEQNVVFSLIPIALTSNQLWLLALGSTELTEFAKVNWLGHLLLNAPPTYLETIATSIVSVLKSISYNEPTISALLTKVVCPAIQKISSRSNYVPVNCSELFEYTSKHHLSMIQTMIRSLILRDIGALKESYRHVLQSEYEKPKLNLLHLEIWNLIVLNYQNLIGETKDLIWSLFGEIFAFDSLSSTESLTVEQISILEELRANLNQIHTYYAKLCKHVIQENRFNDISPHLLPFLATIDVRIKSIAQDIIMMGTKEHMYI